MGEIKTGKGTKYTRCFKAPFRLLIKARDYYVRAMCDWAAHMEKCSGAAGCHAAAAQFSVHSDSYSFHSRNSAQNEELMELMRAASTRNQSNKVDDNFEIIMRSPCVKSPAASERSVWRRGRVGIERIEEDVPCEFGKDVPVEARRG